MEERICKDSGSALRPSLPKSSSGSSRAVSQRASVDCCLAGDNRARDSAFAAHRSARSGRAVRRRARGSSAMPHKRNPVTCEQICGLARLVRSNMLAAFENVALWHERDISHRSVERIILPDSTNLIDYMLAKMTAIIAIARLSGAHVAQPRIHARAGVLGQLLQDLVEKGMPRDDAYKAVQENAMAAWETESSFQERVWQNDARITKFLNSEGLAHRSLICDGRLTRRSTLFSTASSAHILLAKNPQPSMP